LPSGVFAPYSGVKTSILLFNNELAKTKQEILFVKIENDGFDLGATKRPTDKNDLPTALEILNKWNSGKKTENQLTLYVEKSKIAENGDYNLSGDRYRVSIDYTNTKWPMVELLELCEFIGKGERPASFATKEGEFPFIVSSFFIKKCNFADFDMEALIIGDGGSANIHYINGKFSASDHTYILRNKNKEKISLKYIYELLLNNLEVIEKGFQGQGLKNISKKYLESIKIPMPPLEIQEQIVSELNTYQNIISGAKQIAENWKPKIEIDPNWKKVKLPDISENNDNKRKPVTKSDRSSGKYPYYGASGIVDYVENYIFDGDYLLISEDGANLLARNTPIGFSIFGKNWSITMLIF
jgi:type I restriction enzyme M protein